MRKTARIRASLLKGEIDIPPSKSQTMRALVFATLAKGKSTIRNYLSSPDTQAMIQACRLLGAKIDVFSDRIEVVGNIRPAEDVIHAGNSGQVLRFVGAISALTSEYTVLTGDYSIRHLRPVQPLLDGLNQLGCFAVASRGDGQAPIIIRGPLKGGTALIDGQDSQPVSGLLMASAFASQKTEIYVTNPGEQPWVALTLSWFDRFGVSYRNENFEKYSLPGCAVIDGFEYVVPADWSSASYPIAAALITNSELTLHGVDFEDAQGDKEFISLIQEMGAKFEKGKRSLKILPGAQLRGCKIEMGRFIDAITLLAVVGCFAKGKTELVGAEIARRKECDRIRAIVTELKKMGAKIVEKPDGLIVEQSALNGAAIESYSDHRMAMSLTVAALGAAGESVVSGVDSVGKSFPQFFEKLQQLGAKIE